MDDNTIIRVSHNSDQPYFLIARATAQDKSLSFDALGMLVYLLSKPDDWKVMIVDLQREDAGRDKCYNILNELMDHGYVRREQSTRESGQFNNVNYVVFESPLPETPYTASPDTVNPTLHNTDIQSREKQSAPAVPVGASPYGAYASRVPEVVRQKTPSSITEPLSSTDPDFPEIGHDIGKVLDALSNTKAFKITPQQWELLNEKVSTPIGIAPSPVAEKALYPSAWAEFVADIPDMPQWPHHRPSVGEVIKLMRGYNWNGGWFEYKPELAEAFSPPTEPTSIRELPTAEEQANEWV